MTFIDIRNSFIALFEGVKNNKDIKIIEIEDDFELLSKEDKEFVIDNIQDRYKISFNNEMKEMLIPNLTLCWHYTVDGNLKTGGEFNLRGTQALLTDTSKTSFSDSLTDYGKKLYKEGYRFFDSHPHAGDGIFAAIKIEKNSIADTVYLVDIIHEDIAEMDINYTTYIEHTIKLKGMYGWQYLFMSGSLEGYDFDLSYLKQTFEDYQKLFPGIDISNYLKLYKEKGGK